MTLNEKMDHFYTSVIDSATAQSVTIVEDYINTLQKIFDERKQAAERKADSAYRVESDMILREKNRRLSNEIIEIKRKVIEKSAELTDLVFKDVEIKLSEFMQTSSYDDFLCKKITETYEFSMGEEIIIYINSSDQNRKSTLEEITGVTLTVSNRDFIGGIRAVIPSRSILIDYSFLTKLAEEKNSFKL